MIVKQNRIGTEREKVVQHKGDACLEEEGNTSAKAEESKKSCCLEK